MRVLSFGNIDKAASGSRHHLYACNTKISSCVQPHTRFPAAPANSPSMLCHRLKTEAKDEKTMDSALLHWRDLGSEGVATLNCWQNDHKQAVGGAFKVLSCNHYIACALACTAAVRTTVENQYKPSPALPSCCCCRSQLTYAFLSKT